MAPGYPSNLTVVRTYAGASTCSTVYELSNGYRYTVDTNQAMPAEVRAALENTGKFGGGKKR